MEKTQLFTIEEKNKFMRIFKLFVLPFLILGLFQECKEKDPYGKDKLLTIVYNDESKNYDLVYKDAVIGAIQVEIGSEDNIAYIPKYSNNKKIFIDSMGVSLIGSYKQNTPFGCFSYFNSEGSLHSLKWYQGSTKSIFEINNINCKSGVFYTNDGFIDTSLIEQPKVSLVKRNEKYELIAYQNSYPIYYTLVTPNFVDENTFDYNLLTNSFNFKFKSEQLKEDTLRLRFSYKDPNTGNILKENIVSIPVFGSSQK